MVNLYNDGRRRQESGCLVPRRLSFDVRAKEGGKETTGFARYLDPSHGPLRFITSHSRCALASAMRKRSAWGGGWESSILDFQNGFLGFFQLRLNTGIDPTTTTTTTIRRFIDSIRAEKFHLSLENMWKWNKTLILKYLYCLRNFSTARCFSGDII